MAYGRRAIGCRVLLPEKARHADDSFGAPVGAATGFSGLYGAAARRAA